MKIYLIAACLLMAVSIRAEDDPYLEFFKEHTLKCAKENGIKGMTTQEISSEDNKKSSQAPTCLRACVLKEAEIMKDSKINLEKFKEVVDKIHTSHPDMVEKLHKHADECAEQHKHEADECKLAYGYVDCFLNQH